MARLIQVALIDQGFVVRSPISTVINALIKHAKNLPRELYKSLTWDRGKEMADHRLNDLTNLLRPSVESASNC